MTALTATERGDLAERMLPIAAQLACIAHGDGDWHDVHHLTRQLDRDELLTLTLALASMVDPSARIHDALGHITWDEHGNPAEPLPRTTRTVRSVAGKVDGPSGLGADMVLRSERKQLARRMYLVDGLSTAKIGAQLGVDPRTVERWKVEGGWRRRQLPTEADARRLRGLIA